MNYVLTVHWRADFWVDTQIVRLRRYLREPFRLFAACDGMKRDHSAKFDYCAPSAGIEDHATKLNLLADAACATARDDDVLIFCDSDAFPIRDITDWLHAALARHPLVAVQRLENDGDRQPHPCFCATTAGLWRRVGGDWRAGHTWLDVHGQPVTDVGGNLLAALEAHGVEWGRMLRTNRTNLHPLMFGIYDDVVYHHGAGSRPSLGGRGVVNAMLRGMDPQAARARVAELQRELNATSLRIVEMLFAGRDAELRSMLLGEGPPPGAAGR